MPAEGVKEPVVPRISERSVQVRKTREGLLAILMKDSRHGFVGPDQLYLLRTFRMQLPSMSRNPLPQVIT